MNYRDNKWRSPIFYAKTLETAKWLAINNANLDLKDKNGQTSLHLSVINNDYDKSKLLLEYKANPNILNEDKLPPLGYAKTVEMMKLLLENNANPDVVTPKGSTLLHNCVKTNNIEAVYYLLEAKANPNIPDYDNKLPLDYATNNDIYTLLLDAGSEINYRAYLIDALKNKNIENFNNLLECGADANIVDDRGRTAVFYMHDKQELEQLIKHNADINYINSDGFSPILHFALLGKEDQVRLLQEKNVLVNTENLISCRQKYKTYNKWIKSPNSELSFTSNLKYDEYATERERDYLNYKIQLTPAKIDEIIENAPTTDRGLIQAYKELKKEEQQIYNAISSFIYCTKTFWNSRERRT